MKENLRYPLKTIFAEILVLSKDFE